MEQKTGNPRKKSIIYGSVRGQMINYQKAKRRFLKILLLNDIYRDIPEDDIIAKNRFNLFRIFCLACIIVSLVTIYQAYFQLNNQGFILAVLVILFFTFLIDYFTLLWHKGKKLAYALSIFSAFFYLHVITYFSGGIRNSGMFYLGALILTSFMLLGNRLGKLFTLICFINVIYFYYITENTNWVSNILVGSGNTLLNQDFLFTALMSLFLIATQCNNLESSKNVVISNITESRNQLQVKNKELKKLSLVASQTNNGVVITDEKGNIEWINDGFTRLTGYESYEITGKNSGRLLFGSLSDRSSINDLLSKMQKKENGVSELMIYKKNNDPIWMQINMTPILDEKNELSKFIFITSDISERKKAEEKNAEYLGNLEKTNKELDRFAYIVSHDLKAPLRAIGNLTDWISEDAGSTFDAETTGNFSLIKGRVRRMEALINGILAYSRASRKKTTNETVSTGQLVTETLELLDLNENWSVKVGTNMPVIKADRTKLQQVFLNLIGNGFKYNNKPEKEVRIYAEEMSDCWKFSVADNGPGIEQQYHEKIFIIFQTLQSRDELESTGVGLAIVKKIIEDIGGKIWIESQKDQGACFHFTWPRNKQDRTETVFPQEVQTV